MWAASIQQWTAKTSPPTHQETATQEFRFVESHSSFKLDALMLIKLNDKGVRLYTSSRYRRLNPLDWQSRTGRVAKYSPNRAVAYVVWSGRRSFDRVSVDLIEPATPEALKAMLIGAG